MDFGPERNPSKRIKLRIEIDPEDFECSVCSELPATSKDVFQCCNSHLICTTCFGLLESKRCPSCRVDISNPSRPRKIEATLRALGQMTVECDNAECTDQVKRVDLEEHIKNDCGYVEVQCPFELLVGCEWKGHRRLLADHHTTHSVNDLSTALVNYEAVQAKYAAIASGVEYGGTWTAQSLSPFVYFKQQTPLQFINGVALREFVVRPIELGEGLAVYAVFLYGERTENTENPANPWTVSIKIDGIELVSGHIVCPF